MVLNSHGLPTPLGSLVIKAFSLSKSGGIQVGDSWSTIYPVITTV